jgi:hypothetical protein
MTTLDDKLPAELLFAPDGHLTDIALTCVADGEVALLPQPALDHLDACAPCGQRLGEAALRAVIVGEALRARPAVVVAPAPVTPRARRPLPIAALGAALFISMITAGPSILDAVRGLPTTLTRLIGLVPFVMRVMATVTRSTLGGPGALILECASTLVFVAVALQVARVAGRARSMQGGVG